MMDNGIDADVGAITQNIDEAEVVSIYFPMLRKAVLIDNRSNEHVGPMIRIVPMASDSSERLRSIRRFRPQLPRPCSLSLIPWNRRIDSLLSLGVWQHVLRRLDEHPQGADQQEVAEGCLRMLRLLERREILSAIRGERYRTLWARSEVQAD